MKYMRVNAMPLIDLYLFSSDNPATQVGDKIKLKQKKPTGLKKRVYWLKRTKEDK